MAPSLAKEALRKRASWIRDDLDPRIARDGPDIMQPDDVLVLHELFLALQRADLPVSVLRYSRIHTAVLEVAGKATRWPKRLAEECDKIILLWEKKYGKLSDVRPTLFNPNGRLHGICTGVELTRAAILKHWKEHDPSIMDPERGKVHGALGFKPGDWWINGIFAFHAGIIDLASTDGGICASKHGAYAIVMKGSDEIYTESPNRFKYRCRPDDPGRFRMTSAKYMSRYPIRVLRSHNLTSLWSPRSGVRYDGLYTVTGWCIKPINSAEAESDGYNLDWEITLKRDPAEESQESLELAMKHPLAEETDDYMEYKRIRKEVRDGIRDKIMQAIPPTLNTQESPIFNAPSPLTAPPKSEPSSYPGMVCLREPIIPGMPPEPPSMKRTSFAPPEPRASTNPIARPEREVPPPQSRTLTVPSALRKSLSTVSDSKGKKPETAAEKSRADIQVQASSPSHSDKLLREPVITGKSSKSIARSLSRIFDGGRDDQPESPFGTVVEGNEEPLSFPFDESQQDGSSTLVLRQPEWGAQENNPPMEKSWNRKRRDRAVYEALTKQQSPDPRLLLAALDEVWADCGDADYPDMVLEEVDRRKRVRSDNYLFRIPPGGIDVQRFIAQQAGDEFQSRQSTQTDGGETTDGEHVHAIRDVLSELLPDSKVARRQLSNASERSVLSERSIRSSMSAMEETRLSRASRPTIVRFAGLFQGQVLTGSVDETQEAALQDDEAEMASDVDAGSERVAGVETEG